MHRSGRTSQFRAGSLSRQRFPTPLSQILRDQTHSEGGRPPGQRGPTNSGIHSPRRNKANPHCVPERRTFLSGPNPRFLRDQTQWQGSSPAGPHEPGTTRIQSQRANKPISCRAGRFCNNTPDLHSRVFEGTNPFTAKLANRPFQTEEQPKSTPSDGTKPTSAPPATMRTPTPNPGYLRDQTHPPRSPSAGHPVPINPGILSP